jgi:hypothetical protein
MLTAPRGLGVYCQNVFYRHLDRKLRGHCATENAVDICRGAAKYICKVCPVGEQASVFNIDRQLIDRRYIVLRRQRNDLRAMDFHKIIRHDEKTTSRLAA